MSNLITGLFDTPDAARAAVAQLKQHGYTPGEISVIMKDAEEARHITEEDSAATGRSTVGIGGGVGALLGGLLAVSAVAIPGIGLIAAGALAAMFVGGGALTGSAVGWFVDQGIPADLAPYYERGLHEGGVVVAVAAHPGDETQVYDLLHPTSLAASGHETASYVAPIFAARHADLSPPTALSTLAAQAAPVQNPLAHAVLTPVPVNALPSNLAGKQEHAPIRVAVLDEIRATQQAAVEHERDARREALLANPLSHDDAAAPSHAAFTGLEHTPKSS